MNRVAALIIVLSLALLAILFGMPSDLWFGPLF